MFENFFGRLAARTLKTCASGLTKIIGPLVRLRNHANYLSGRHAFVPRSDDIYIVSYPRSGTTWLQMILHQIRGEGDLNFQHVSEVIPYFERSFYIGRSLEDLESPRIFKSHLSVRAVYRRDAKYIYVARDGRDVMVSFYQMHKTHMSFKGNFELFFRLFMEGRLKHGSWFRHVDQWSGKSSERNVLFMNYDELVEDLEGSVKKVADFCGYSIHPASLPRILERCSFSYMKRHEYKFDHATEILMEMGVQSNEFIREGVPGQGKLVLDSYQMDLFEKSLAAYPGVAKKFPVRFASPA